MKEHHLNIEELDYFKEKLLARRHELLDDRDALQEEALRKASKSDETGDLSNTPIHQADLGTDTFAQEVKLDRMERGRELIREIDHAVEKITDNTYGLCEADGSIIARKRLEAIPWTRYCLECEAKQEK